MSGNGKPIRGLDVPIVKLVPRSERKVSKKYYKRIEASLRAVGLIDPLIVFPQGDNYEILDGCLRYRILLDLGVETVPCLLGNQREAFTGNRMVNQLSASQEMRMLRKSLEELDEKTNDLLKRLHQAEEQQEFFSGLYRQYTTNLLKLVIYVRSLLSNQRVRQYLEEHHAQQLAVFEQIINSTER